MAHPDRNGLRGLQETLGALGKFLEVQFSLPFRRDMVLYFGNTSHLLIFLLLPA
jgi:hypothetical protein